MLVNTVSQFKRLLSCKKGASSELLSAVGLIAISVGILVVVSPILSTQVRQLVTNALTHASTLFTQVLTTP
jgi:uncharacterized membrane protein YbaN (DUF454 family)